MSRLLLSILVLAASILIAPTQGLPEFPQQAHLASAPEVKAYSHVRVLLAISLTIR